MKRILAHLYDSSLRPSGLFGIVLLLLSLTGVMLWTASLLEQDEFVFETGGLVLLGLSVAFGILSLLFLLRVRGVRLLASLALHLLILILIVRFVRVWDGEDLPHTLHEAAVTFFGVGFSLAAIAALHCRSMRKDFAPGPRSGTVATGDAEPGPPDVTKGSRGGRRVLFGLICILLILVVLGAWRIVPLLIAQPTITVDFLAQYDQVAKPVSYDSNLDAGPYYRELFTNFTELPEILADGRWERWPTEMPPEHHESLQQWIAANSLAFEAFRRATERPFWWIEAESPDGSVVRIERPYIQQLRSCTFGVVALAQYEASRGNTRAALDLLLDLHRMGVHSLQQVTLLEQLVGLAICERSYKATAIVLCRCEVDPETLRRVHSAFAVQVPQVDVPRFMPGEFLLAADWIQRAFTDDGRQDGKLIPRELHKARKEGGLYSEPMSFSMAVWICLDHPGRRQTVEVWRAFLEKAQILAETTPWQMQQGHTSYEQELVEEVKNARCLRDSVPYFPRVLEVAWRGRTAGQALLAALAILAHKADKDCLPDSLQELVTKGYLDRLPMDPYSGDALVYKKTEDGFTLYSVGEDFVDDGGVTFELGEGGVVADQVFWPVEAPSEDEEDSLP
jgi:hypothetical protein